MARRKVQLGQFYTSRPIADFMVGLADAPTPATRALEPGIGAGVFLDALLDAGFNRPVGFDLDEGNVQAAHDRLGDLAQVTHSDFLDVPAAGAYDLVVGNPPYVAWGNLDDATRRRLLEDPFWAPLSNGQWDLLYAFIIWGAQQLRPGGQLIYIVPFNWFNSTYAATLRGHLAKEGQFEDLIHFGEFKLFADCYPNCLIFSWRKGAQPSRPFVVEYDGAKGPVQPVIDQLTQVYSRRTHAAGYRHTDGLWSAFTQPQPKAGELWYLADDATRERIDRLESACDRQTLAGAAQIAVGMVSGRDSAYLIDPDSSHNEQEREAIAQVVKARSLRPFAVGATQPMIFADHITDEATLRCQLPVLHAHLSGHREALEGRYLSAGKQWWQWATVRNLEAVRDAKRSVIWVPCIDRSPVIRAARSQPGLLAGGDVLAIIAHPGLPEDDRYLLGWLNSSAVNDWYRVKGSRTGRRIRYTQAYMQHVPLRRINFDDPAQVSCHDRICDAVSEAESGAINEQQARARIDQQVAALLGS